MEYLIGIVEVFIKFKGQHTQHSVKMLWTDFHGIQTKLSLFKTANVIIKNRKAKLVLWFKLWKLQTENKLIKLKKFSLCDV